MSAERERCLDPSVQSAVDELREVISRRYPSASFDIVSDPDETENVDMWTTVDLDDPDEVLDLVIDRLLQLQVEERVPVHVIPVRSPERVLAELSSRRQPRKL